jgi:hypothetical protein
MKRPNKNGKRVVPQPGGESFQVGEAGPPIYHMLMPPVKSRGQLIPLGEWQIGEAGPPMTPDEYKAYCEREGILDPDRPLIPSPEEVAKLPLSARVAFARRCAARIAPLAVSAIPQELNPQATASFLLAAATVQTPLRRLLWCIRRDFDKMLYLARKQKWTDDTQVPSDVFGPMWPNDLAPAWAREEQKPPVNPA